MIHIATATGDQSDMIQAIRQGHPVLEIRLDALWSTVPDADQASQDLAALIEAAEDTGTRLLATLRPARQGGAFNGPEEIRINLLLAAIQSGFEIVDLENDHTHIGQIVHMFHEAGAHVVLSDHQLVEPPSREEGLKRLTSMQDMRGEWQKLAFSCGSFMDGLRALELAHGHAHKSGTPIVTPMGGGPALRALLSVAGNHGDYGHANGNRPAVPGQPASADIAAIRSHWGLPDAPGDAEAGWLAVIGDPIDHSLSPRIHNAALQAAGRAEQYGALQVPDSAGAMRLLCTVAPRIGLRGVSVTAPLKQHAAGIAADDAVRAIGAANCLRFGPAGTEATNTDALAIQTFLQASHGETVAVLGAGGAARAAIHAAKQQGSQVTFTSRDEARAKQVHDQLGAVWAPWDRRHDIRADTWIQATPIGTDASDPPPLDRRDLDGASTCIEMVYAHGPTSLQQVAQDAGLDVIDGQAMLVEQAVHAYHYWLGEKPDRSAMQKAMEASP